MDDEAVIVICQGPPRCGLQGDAAIEAQQAGCPWCQRITIGADGSEAVNGPLEA